MRMRRHMGEMGAVVCRLLLAAPKAWSVVCIALLCNAMPVLASAVPFVETFEDTPAGMASNTAEVLHGQHGWEVSPTNTAIVQTSVRYAGAKGGSMTNSIVSHDFETANATNVWVDFYARVPARGDEWPPTLSSGSSLGFYIDQNFNAVATDADVWVTNTVYVFSNDSWVRFTANVDYIATNWSLYVAGATANEMATNLFTDLDFRSGTVSNYLSKFKVTGESEDTMIYMDSISMGRDDVEGKPAHIDSDYDRMSDKWEIDRFGDLAYTAAGDPDGDGRSNLAEFTAGTDPTNVLSFLHIVNVDISAPDSSNITVTWEGGGYSVTSIYAGDTIDRTYSLMASDNSYGAATSLVASVADINFTVTTNTWMDEAAADLYDSRFYHVILADYAGFVATNVEDWAMFKQYRAPSKMYMICAPIDYETTNNNLNAKLGVHLARGLHANSSALLADKLFIRDPVTGGDDAYYLDLDGWRTNGAVTGRANIELDPGDAMWIERASGGVSRSNTVFAGRTWSASTVSNIMIYAKTSSTNGWNMIGWANVENKTVSGSDTSTNQLGFSAAGGRGATTGDLMYPNELGDMICIWRDGYWRRLWLIEGASAKANGRWWDDSAWTWASWTFKPGEAFYYYHPTNNFGGGDFEWDPVP